MTRRDKPKTISAHIRAAIEDSDVSRYRIANATQIAESTLSRFLSGERGLSMEAIDTLGEYFGLDVVQRGKRRS